MANNAFNASDFAGQKTAVDNLEKKNQELDATEKKRAQENWDAFLAETHSLSADLFEKGGHKDVADLYGHLHDSIVKGRRTGQLNFSASTPQQEVPAIEVATVVELDDDTKERIGRLEKILGSTLVSVGLDNSVISKIIAGEVKPEAAKEMVDKIVTASIASAEKPAPKLKDGEVVISEKDSVVIPAPQFKEGIKVLENALDGHIPSLSGLGAKMTVNGEAKSPTDTYVVDVDKATKGQELIGSWTEIANAKK